MTKVKIKGFVHVRTGYNDSNVRYYEFFQTDMSGHDGFGLCVGPAEFEYEPPADFNPVAVEIAALEKRKAEALRVYSEMVTQLNDRISKLQAITYDEPGEQS